MNKKMKELYARVDFLGDWAKELQADLIKSPEKEEIYSALLTEIGLKMIALTYEIDEERAAYQKLPLWKQLLRK